jgi:ABC-type multidrug transport system fused ATPase/permease subunit
LFKLYFIIHFRRAPFRAINRGDEIKELENDIIIKLNDISIAFDNEPVLDHIDLSIRDGEFVTILGPSGCGKTTTLRIIGGFVEPDSAVMSYSMVKDINGTPPNKTKCEHGIPALCFVSSSQCL